MNYYDNAKAIYAELGVDTDEAINRLAKIKISLQCWQGDDVRGFMNNSDLSGGIQVTGNYKGAARTPDELRSDISKALSLIPGKHKVALHAIYADAQDHHLGGDYNRIEPKHFDSWADWAKENGLGIDFNPTFFSHKNSEKGFTLSSSDNSVRDYWINHGKLCRKISEHIGKKVGQTVVDNFWIPDGFKDNPVDRLAPRERLLSALDEVFAEQIDENLTIDAVESKLFGIGAEAYTVGSHEFYMGYAMSRNKLLCLDSGHFHPTEVISNKLSSVSLFTKGMLLHVSRPIRWDSDHVVIFDDELQEIANELVRNNLLAKTYIGLDFFDATINRIAAWVIGTRNMQKALLKALLEPTDMLKRIELEEDYTKRLAIIEELKLYPFGAVWDHFCEINNVPKRTEWLKDVAAYENDILSKRI